jgi:hypothetical protein
MRVSSALLLSVLCCKSLPVSGMLCNQFGAIWKLIVFGVQSDVPRLTSSVTAVDLYRPFRRIGRVQRVRRMGNTDTTQTDSHGGSQAMDGDISTTLETTAGLELQNDTLLKRTRDKSVAATGQTAAAKSPVQSPATTTTEANASDTESNPDEPPSAEQCAGDDRSATGKKSKPQQQGKKRKKQQGPCPVWESVVNAVKSKDAATAWEQYQHHKNEYNFSVFQLQALATLFLGMCSSAFLAH